MKSCREISVWASSKVPTKSHRIRLRRPTWSSYWSSCYPLSSISGWMNHTIASSAWARTQRGDFQSFSSPRKSIWSRNCKCSSAQGRSDSSATWAPLSTWVMLPSSFMTSMIGARYLGGATQRINRWYRCGFGPRQSRWSSRSRATQSLTKTGQGATAGRLATSMRTAPTTRSSWFQNSRSGKARGGPKCSAPKQWWASRQTTQWCSGKGSLRVSMQLTTRTVTLPSLTFRVSEFSYQAMTGPLR